jgi:hypothetical protein
MTLLPWSERMVGDIRSGSPNWVWHLYEYWCGLDEGDRMNFFDCLEPWSTFDGLVVSCVRRAEFFWCVWTSERVWDCDAALAHVMLLAFHSIESDVSDEVERAYVASVKRACPHLTELDDADLNWTGYRLPVELRDLPNP